MKDNIQRKNMNIKYDGYKFSITEKNPLFSESKIYVMYHGENRNNSVIAKEDVNKAIQSIYNVPIVGEFVESQEDDSNFGGHGGKIVIDDSGMKFIHTTKPIGLVPESANVYWETVKDEKEQEKEYLVVDGALVWNRYEKEVNTLKSANFGQSMEVEVEDGFFDDEEGKFHIKDFLFSALCILGIDGKKNGKVEPAFEDSKIITYSSENMMSEMQEMKNELKKFYSLHLSGKEENTLSLDKVKKFEEEIKDENKDDDSKDEKDEKEDTVEPETTQTETEGIDGQLIEDEEEAVKSEGTSGDLEGEDAGVDDESVRETADKNTDSGEATPNSDIDNTADANTESTDYAKKYEELKEEHEKVLSELSELKEFKAKVDKESHEKEAVELFQKIGLDASDVESIDIYEFSIEELEEKGYAILGKKLANKSKEFSHEKAEGAKISNKISLNQSGSAKKEEKYGNLFIKYSNK